MQMYGFSFFLNCFLTIVFLIVSRNLPYITIQFLLYILWSNLLYRGIKNIGPFLWNKLHVASFLFFSSLENWLSELLLCFKWGIKRNKNYIYSPVIQGPLFLWKPSMDKIGNGFLTEFIPVVFFSGDGKGINRLDWLKCMGQFFLAKFKTGNRYLRLIREWKPRQQKLIIICISG